MGNAKSGGNDLSTLRHNMDNALLSLETLADELKDETLSKATRKERVGELEDYIKKVTVIWDEYKKLTR